MKRKLSAYRKKSARKVSKAVKKYVAKAITADDELKQYCSFSTGGALTNTTNWFCLNDPEGRTTVTVNTLGVPVNLSLNPGQQGVGSYQRIGDIIRIKRLNLRFKLYQNALAATSFVRVMLIQDMGANGQQPVASEILYDTGATLGYISPYRVRPDGEYKVLMDKTIGLNQYLANNNAGAWSMQANAQIIKINKNKLNIKTEYFTDTAYTDYRGISRNGLWLLLMPSDSNVTVGQIYSSIAYTDA